MVTLVIFTKKAELTIKLVNAFVPPKIPLKVIVPVPADAVKVFVPFTVLPKVINPLPDVRVKLPFNVTAPVNTIGPLPALESKVVSKPLKVTASPILIPTAPFDFTLVQAAANTAVPPTFVVKPNNGTFAPITLLKVVAPVELTVKLPGPSIVLPKVTNPAPELIILFAANVTGSLKIMGPVVVIFAPRKVLPAAFVVKLSNAVPPTIPENVFIPEEVTIKFLAPLTVLPKVTAPLPAVAVKSPLKVTAPIKATGPFPVLEFKVVSAALNVTAFSMSIPSAPLVVTPVHAAEKTDVPPAFVVKLKSGVVPPTTLLKVVVPVEFKVKFPAPFKAPPNVIAPLPVLNTASPNKVTLSLNTMAAFVVVIFPPTTVVPTALVVNVDNALVPPPAPIAPVKVVVPVEFKVNVRTTPPPLTIVLPKVMSPALLV